MPKKKNRKLFDIALTGIGIGGFEQVTLETLWAFKNARVIFHLTSHHRRLKKYCKNVVNLENQYWTGEVDSDVYERLANMILDEAKNGPGVVSVGDGHPAYYDDVTWDVFRRGRKRGLDVRIIPAISCIDSMAANCGLEINTGGLQIFDATVMIAANQRMNPYVDNLIMQIGWFGTALIFDIAQGKKGRYAPVIKYLTQFYPETHQVRILHAPYDKTESPTVITTKLATLDKYHKRILPSMCLFIPALVDDSANARFEEYMARARSEENLRDMAILNE